MVDWTFSDAALVTVIAASIASAMLLAPLVVARPASEQNLLSTEQWRDSQQQFDAAVAHVDAKILAPSDHNIELELKLERPK